jgi:MFS family permease
VTRQARALLVLASVSLAGFLIIPANSTIGVFITPLMKEFGWSHAQASRIATAYLLTYGLTGPLVGWVLDRVAAQWVMATGTIAVIVALLCASHLNSLGPLFAMYAVIGFGVQAAYHIPGFVVTVNWFKERRGLATGCFLGVSTAGLALAPTPVTRIVLAWGWRVAMRLMAVPMVLVALPLVLLFARTRPTDDRGIATPHFQTDTPGLEIGPALRTLPFWLMIGAQILYFMAFNGVFYLLVPYLISIGYSPQAAAHIFGVQALGAVLGFFGSGALTDRYGARRIVMIGIGVDGLALIELMLAGGHHASLLPLILFIMTWGTFASGPTGMMPVLMAESLGLRRYGTLVGLLHMVGSAGAAISPVLAGWLVDVTGSYRTAWEMYALFAFIGASLVCFVAPAKGHDQIPDSAAA